jgi:NAD(P)H-hydrate epimerase
VLKGAATVVAEPGGTAWINPTGNHGLAKGGSGDVLAGLIAGLLAQGMATAEAAAVAAVYLHGLAADLVASRMGHRTILAGDVIDAMGDALRQVGWEPS